MDSNRPYWMPHERALIEAVKKDKRIFMKPLILPGAKSTVNEDAWTDIAERLIKDRKIIKREWSVIFTKYEQLRSLVREKRVSEEYLQNCPSTSKYMDGTLSFLNPYLVHIYNVDTSDLINDIPCLDNINMDFVNKSIVTRDKIKMLIAIKEKKGDENKSLEGIDLDYILQFVKDSLLDDPFGRLTKKIPDEVLEKQDLTAVSKSNQVSRAQLGQPVTNTQLPVQSLNIQTNQLSQITSNQPALMQGILPLSMVPVQPTDISNQQNTGLILSNNLGILVPNNSLILQGTQPVTLYGNPVMQSNQPIMNIPEKQMVNADNNQIITIKPDLTTVQNSCTSTLDDIEKQIPENILDKPNSRQAGKSGGINNNFQDFEATVKKNLSIEETKQLWLGIDKLLQKIIGQRKVDTIKP